MIMQNLGGQTKSIMVFSEVAYKTEGRYKTKGNGSAFKHDIVSTIHKRITLNI